MVQDRVIKSLQLALQHENAAVNFTVLHEASITNTKDVLIALDDWKKSVSMGHGTYKVCSEIQVLKMVSDAQLFLEMKKRYFEKRGRWSRFNILVKQTTVEFIQVQALHSKQ